MCVRVCFLFFFSVFCSSCVCVSFVCFVLVLDCVLCVFCGPKRKYSPAPLRLFFWHSERGPDNNSWAAAGEAMSSFFLSCRAHWHLSPPLCVSAFFFPLPLYFLAHHTLPFFLLAFPPPPGSLPNAPHHCPCIACFSLFIATFRKATKDSERDRERQEACFCFRSFCV